MILFCDAQPELNRFFWSKPVLLIFLVCVFGTKGVVFVHVRLSVLGSAFSTRLKCFNFEENYTLFPLLSLTVCHLVSDEFRMFVLRLMPKLVKSQSKLIHLRIWHPWFWVCGCLNIGACSFTVYFFYFNPGDFWGLWYCRVAKLHSGAITYYFVCVKLLCLIRYLFICLASWAQLFEVVTSAALDTKLYLSLLFFGQHFGFIW